MALGASPGEMLFYAWYETDACGCEGRRCEGHTVGARGAGARGAGCEGDGVSGGVEDRGTPTRFSLYVDLLVSLNLFSRTSSCTVPPLRVESSLLKKSD